MICIKYCAKHWGQNSDKIIFPKSSESGIHIHINFATCMNLCAWVCVSIFSRVYMCIY